MSEHLNPNSFGAQQLARAREDMIAALDRGQLFRYVDDGRDSACDLFEEEAARWLGVHGALTVSSGTAGLRMALRALGVGPGDVVLVPAFTFVATAAAVVSLGATPEPLDVGDGLGPALDDLDARLHPGVRAVIAVHVQGHAVELAGVVARLAQVGVPLVEDACQGFGALCRGCPAGTVGDVGVFSFQQSKQLCSGEGGLVVARSPRLLDGVRRLTDLGAVRDAEGYPSWDPPDAIVSENLRMTELQAVLLRRQLAELDATLSSQREARRMVHEALGETARAMVLSSDDPLGDAGSHLLLRTPDAAHAQAVIANAAAEEVLVRQVWPRPWYLHGAFDRAGLSPAARGVQPAVRAEALGPCLVSVPTPGRLRAEDARRVAHVIDGAVEMHRDGA